MSDRTPATDTQPDTSTGQGRTVADILRFVPPVSALGTAFVLQVIAVTDIVGTAMAPRVGQWAYIGAALLGLSVASCFEGGAAYLMDLYDKHLLAGDSVWVLRLGMIVYVAASAAAIHWWTQYRGLPEITSWLLAGMSASALFLWSRGSRWRRREVMRKQGLIDTALPRLSVAAKIFHPVRWITTLYLVSWRPARTPAEARDRYEAHRAKRTPEPLPTGQVPEVAERTEAPRVRPAVPNSPDTPRNVVALTERRTPTRTGGQPTVAELADTLGKRHGGQVIGKPKALETLRQVYGTCSAERAIAAKDEHNSRVQRTREADTDADSEHTQGAVVS